MTTPLSLFVISSLLNQQRQSQLVNDSHLSPIPFNFIISVPALNAVEKDIDAKYKM